MAEKEKTASDMIETCSTCGQPRFKGQKCSNMYCQSHKKKD